MSDETNTEIENNPLAMSDDEFESFLSSMGKTTEPEVNATEEVVEESDETPEPATEEPTTEEPVVNAIDYEAEYKRLMAPFKANNKEMQVESVEDAISLMQMGANYNKKMGALKPNLKLLKLLEKHDLLDEGKLNYLIDLQGKNPEAVKKFLKDNEIDPLSYDSEEEPNYKATKREISDKELEFDNIIEEIRHTDAFVRTTDIITKQWDEASKKVVAENPFILGVINEHVGNGIYDKIVQVVERERMFGRLKGMSDIEAYKAVGDRMFAQQPEAPKPQPKPPVDNTDRKKAVAPVKPGKPAKSLNKDFNPLAMSDEEFLKMLPKYM